MAVHFPEKCQGCGIQCMEKIEFLQGIPDNKLASLMAHAVHENYEKGNFLFREEDPVAEIFIISGGKVKLSTIDGEGREQIVGIFADYDTIWEGVFMDESRYPYDGVCMTDVECCRIYRKDLEKVLEDGKVALKVIALLSKKLHDANERTLLLSTNDPKARLAGFLLYRSVHLASDTVTLKLDDIAASISLRPETVSRKIKELEREDAIRKVGQSGIQILDIELLKEIAKN